MGGPLRAVLVLVVICAVLYVSGIWSRIAREMRVEERLQPWFLDGPAGPFFARAYPMFAGWLYPGKRD